MAIVNGEVSFWYADGGLPEPGPGLTESTTADVAVVGAGYTGLWTAYYLKQARPDQPLLPFPPSRFPSVRFPITARVFPLPLVECKIFRSTPQLISVLDILIPGPPRTRAHASTRQPCGAAVGGFMADLRRRTDMIELWPSTGGGRIWP